MEKPEEEFSELTSADQAYQVILSLVRRRSREGRLTYAHEIENALFEHGLLKSKEMEGRRAEFERLFIRTREESLEIRIAAAGKQRVGYYSDHYMCEMFATLQAWKKQDPILLMAEIVRFNSFRHRRPTVKSLFEKIPFLFSPREIEANLEAMNGQEAFEDIARTVTPVGTECIYSTRYLDPDEAPRLAQFYDLGESIK